jgi:uncharacterized protein (TIGR03663 family)
MTGPRDDETVSDGDQSAGSDPSADDGSASDGDTDPASRPGPRTQSPGGSDGPSAGDEPDRSDGPDGQAFPSLRTQLADDPIGTVAGRLGAVDVRRAVLAIAAVALLARLVALGARPMHYDEGRVGYWVLHYLESGSVTYRHGIHGPFIQHVDRWLFALVGPGDFAARLPVAVVGGLLPLVALTFREHLHKSETVVLALFLGFNSVLVYYSRFMRSDVLLAGFMFGALGLLVRTYDTRDARYLYGVAVLAGFGFAAKENAIVYVLTWVGATALLSDQALFRPRRFRSGRALLRSRIGELRAAGRDLLPPAGHVLGAIALFLFVLVFMYADRGAGMAGITRPPVPPGQGAVGFWEALSNPVGFPGYAYDTLARSVDEALQWSGRTGAGDSESLVDTYVSHLGTDLEVLASNAPVVLAFAAVGFVYERYGRETSRNLVLFAGYCGFVSVLGYPLADDIGGAHWLHVHALVPLAVPAAAGVAAVYRWGRSATLGRDAVVTTAVAFVLVLAGAQVALATAGDVYGDTTSRENPLAQYAQPEADFRAVADAVDRSTATGSGPDVVLYTGADFDGPRPLVSPPDSGNHSFVLRPACVGEAWYNGIPLHWYLNTAGADVSCVTDPAQLTAVATERSPPLIVTRAPDGSVPTGRLDEGYAGRTVDVYQWDHRVAVYLRGDLTDDVPGWPTAGDPTAR